MTAERPLYDIFHIENCPLAKHIRVGDNCFIPTGFVSGATLYNKGKRQ